MWKWVLFAFSIGLISLEGHQLVDLRRHNPSFRFDGISTAYLVEEAAVKLSRVQRDLEKEGISLIILRGYLPESESPACFVDVNQDRISHTFSRGTAVDVTMEYISGNPLGLPCVPYTWMIDPCWESSGFAPTCGCSCALQRLEKAMQRHGFLRSEKVWWHFEYKSWTLYPPLNIPLIQLAYKKSCRE